MIENARATFHRQVLAIDIRVERAFRCDDELEQTIRLEFDLSMVLLDTDST